MAPRLALNSTTHDLQQLLFATAFAHSSRLSPQDTTHHFHTQNNTTYAEYINFAVAAAAWIISAVTVWISMWLSLKKIVVFNVFLLDKLILHIKVYIQPSDVSQPCGNTV